jgi:hypothetical protein
MTNEWMGGAFDASGTCAIHRGGNKRYIIALRMNGPTSLIFKKIRGRGYLSIDYSYGVTDNAAYRLACDLLPFTFLQHDNLKALIEFYEINRAIGYTLRTAKRWNNFELAIELEAKRNEAYKDFKNKYHTI